MRRVLQLAFACWAQGPTRGCAKRHRIFRRSEQDNRAVHKTCVQDNRRQLWETLCQRSQVMRINSCHRTLRRKQVVRGQRWRCTSHHEPIWKSSGPLCWPQGEEAWRTASHQELGRIHSLRSCTGAPGHFASLWRLRLQKHRDDD